MTTMKLAIGLDLTDTLPLQYKYTPSSAHDLCAFHACPVSAARFSPISSCQGIYAGTTAEPASAAAALPCHTDLPYVFDSPTPHPHLLPHIWLHRLLPASSIISSLSSSTQIFATIAITMAQRATSPAEDHSSTFSRRQSTASAFEMSAADDSEGTNAASSPLCAVLHPSAAQCPRHCPGQDGPSHFSQTPAGLAMSEQSSELPMPFIYPGETFSSFYKQSFTPGQAHLAQPEVRTGELPARDRIDSKMTGRKRSSNVCQHTGQPQLAEEGSPSEQVDRPEPSTQIDIVQAPAISQVPATSLPHASSQPTDEDPFLDGPARTNRPQSPGTSARSHSTERLPVNNEAHITEEELESQYRTEPSRRSNWM
jgi:hypothetical protein